MNELDRRRESDFGVRARAIECRPSSQSTRPMLPSPSGLRRAGKSDRQPEAQEPPKLLTIRDLSALLRISVRELWRMRDKGRLPNPIGFGPKNLRWSREEVLAWVEAGCPDRMTWEAIRGGRGRGK